MFGEIVKWEIWSSEQYPGMVELSGIDAEGKRYYAVETICGRICLRESSHPESVDKSELITGDTSEATVQDVLKAKL
jgi:hypothetical protein